MQNSMFLPSIFILFKKSEKEFDKLTFGNTALSNVKFDIFTCPTNSVPPGINQTEYLPLSIY
jgi:hypothetical protein